MQAVILAAGRGTRMNTLTDSVPKPMLKVAGKTLLEHKFDVLEGVFDEIVLIIGYQGDVIRNAFGDSYNGKKLTYVVQDELNGTMGALALAKPFLHGRFIILMGDDIYGADDIARSVAASDWVMLVEDTKSMAAGGRIVTDEAGKVVAIEEGDHRGKPGLFNTNLFVLDPTVFDYPMVPKAEGSVEYGLPQTVLAASLASSTPLHAIPAHEWFQVTAPEDIERAEAYLKTIEDRA